ncbi:MAG TPA: DUF72 domain-containing protein [Acidobacteriaceae bacterium]
MTSSPVLRIGTAGWTLPKQHAHYFPAEGSHLARCATGFNCVEINSSFHRPHMRKTWERWATCTPDNFRFAVKIPKTITHQAKLIDCGGLLQTFLGEALGLNAGPIPKLGPLLIQLPPKLAFDEGVAHEFFTTFRELYPAEGSDLGLAVCEPRHASWFAPDVDRLLRSFEIARVAADPAKGSPLAGKPGGWNGLRYWRLHGSPRTYYSAYSNAFLKDFAKQIDTERVKAPAGTWVIFDNTALGYGTENALMLWHQVAALDASGSSDEKPRPRSAKRAKVS